MELVREERRELVLEGLRVAVAELGERREELAVEQQVRKQVGLR